MTALMGELLGREIGICGGKGGSMHLTSAEHGAMGSYAIVGAHLPIAAGAAWSAQVRGTGQVAVCFFGDGATSCDRKWACASCFPTRKWRLRRRPKRRC
jgi:pyruvate dehydrogenase E1 component alpha subunit